MAKTGGSGKEYSKDKNGAITVSRPNGTTSTVKPGDKNYNSTVNSMHADGVKNPGSSSSSKPSSSSSKPSSSGGGSSSNRPSTSGGGSSSGGTSNKPSSSGGMNDHANYINNTFNGGISSYVQDLEKRKNNAIASGDYTTVQKVNNELNRLNYKGQVVLNPNTGGFEYGVGQNFSQNQYLQYMGVPNGSTVNGQQVWYDNPGMTGGYGEQPGLPNGGMIGGQQPDYSGMFDDLFKQFEEQMKKQQEMYNTQLQNTMNGVNYYNKQNAKNSMGFMSTNQSAGQGAGSMGTTGGSYTGYNKGGDGKQQAISRYLSDSQYGRKTVNNI